MHATLHYAGQTAAKFAKLGNANKPGSVFV